MKVGWKLFLAEIFGGTTAVHIPKETYQNNEGKNEILPFSPLQRQN
jgi:hypothetical protein